MRRKIAATALAGTLLATVLGAAGATAADNDVEFTVQEGLLTLSQDAGTKALAAADGLSFGTAAEVSGQLNQVTVNDQRGGLLPKGWQVTTTWTSFETEGTAAEGDEASIPATAGKAYIATADQLTNLATDLLSITSGTQALTQATELTPVTFDGTAYSGPIVTGGTTGTGTLDFVPSFAVAVPADAAPGTYTGTVTMTVIP